MRLIAFSVQGYRRFAERTSVKLHGDLVAFVGPNEAGKSSILEALAHLHDRDPFSYLDRPRRTQLNPELTWHWQLETADRKAIAGIHDCRHLERVAVTKHTDGRATWGLFPRRPERDRRPRETLLERLRQFRELPILLETAHNEETEFSLELYDGVIAAIEADPRDFTAEELQDFRALADELRLVRRPQEQGTQTEEAQQIKVNPEWPPQSLAASLRELAGVEGQQSPAQLAITALSKRLPKIQTFKAADRDLSSTYDLRDVADNPPAALNHLAALADLDLKALLQEASDERIADVSTRRNAANRQLKKIFAQSWNQDDISIQIDVQGTVLYVQVATPSDKGLSDISERSEGMRWFAALLAFSYGWAHNPIILIDELETHLHYDAQADLIEVLSKQKFASKVIYSTHSFGCLPHDLGTGVRVVQPVDSASSRLENGFWKGGAGFSPLLASMGAAALSFTPARRAILAEGPSDAILLPTLLRQAAKVSRLGFQIAPGLASVAALAAADLETEAGRVAYVVDGDESGLAIKEKLESAGIPADDVIVLADESGNALETEDFIDEDLYLNAVMEELTCWNEVNHFLTAGELGAWMRSKALKRWCEVHGYKYPDKTAVAQRIVEISVEKRVFSSTQQRLLSDLLQTIRAKLHIRV